MENALFVFRKHPVELILIISSIVITGVIIFLYSPQPQDSEVLAINESSSEVKANEFITYTIDISGAVNKPGVYKVDSNITLDEAIKKAGGFSKEAAKDFIGRNFNLAKNITDKEKIYIPSENDIEKGLYTQEHVPIQGTTTESDNQPQADTETNGISINTASLDDLDALSGVGPVTAQKIIDNRPYESIDELVSKKAVNNSTFNKIKDLISL